MTRATVPLRTNTSGIRGVRPRWRKGRYGRPQLGLDVRYSDGIAQRFTTLPPTLEGMQRALQLREQTEGQVIPISAQRGLQMVLKAAKERQR